MPSEDPRVAAALEALSHPLAAFRAALATALAQAEAVLAETEADAAQRAGRAAAELGTFAEGRIRPDRFAALSRAAAPLDQAAGSALRRAVAVLRRMVERGDRAFVVEVPAAGDLALVVRRTLEQIGRAFGAVALAELVRSGRYRPEEHAGLLERGDFAGWNRVERGLAPPLLAVLDGADLHAAALADFCDGRIKLVLVIRGDCAPAPLVRLITPGTLVLQTTEVSDLARVAAYAGPAVAAWLPPGAARFLHDPDAGGEPWQRLSVRELPPAPRRTLGGVSPWQMAEDLRQLEALARTPFAIPSGRRDGERALGGAEAVERLAAWLLQPGEPAP